MRWRDVQTIRRVSLLAGLCLIFGCASRPTSAPSAEPSSASDSEGGEAQAPARPAPPTMKMTTTIPEGIATPDRLETRLGTLTSFDGVPDPRTTKVVYDNLDFQRAVQGFLSSLQIASLEAMRDGLLKFGPANSTVLVFEELMDSKSLFLTPNTTSVYNFMWLEVGDEPVVLETPPDVLGFVDDAWFKYVVDFGRVGPDKGKGGKFLILPPGYEGKVPKGYFVAKTQTKGNWVVWRGFQKDGSPKAAVEATKSKFRAYPLSQRKNSTTPNFVNVSGEEFNTIHRMDFRFWEEVDAVLQRESADGLNPEIRGLLASIGIVKGKPFAPDDRMKKMLTEAAQVGSVTARALTAFPRDPRAYLYEDRVWTNPLFERRYDFLSDGATMLDGRVYMHFYATGITPAMALKLIGKGSQYAIAYMDQDRKVLDGSKTYKIHLPPNVPAADFWSLTVYDNQTRSMLQTDQQFPGIDNKKQGLKQNADGSYDIYFAPEPPEGWENNWVQTIPNKSWNAILRLYGPLEPFYDQTWRPDDPVLVVD
jgi:hypothetical protein